MTNHTDHNPSSSLALLSLKPQLDAWVEKFNQPDFIPNDPISIPHRFTKKQDIEIAGFFAAVLAWGQRPVILRKCNELFGLMDNAPHDFILHHREQELVPLAHFKHRTFQPADLMYFLEWLQWWYSKNDSLEDAFARFLRREDEDASPALLGFHDLFFSLPNAPQRSRKHIGTPARNAACKRINMYLRWMVRRDDRGVDFGLWSKISMNQLLCPLDLHVSRQARKLGLLKRKQDDWQAVLELTANLCLLDPADPVKYDFALFGLGVSQQ